MTNAKKVIQAYALAKASERLDGIKYDVVSGSTSYIRFNGVNFLEFDNDVDANRICNKLNNSLDRVLPDLKAYYETKIQEILNA